MQSFSKMMILATSAEAMNMLPRLGRVVRNNPEASSAWLQTVLHRERRERREAVRRQAIGARKGIQRVNQPTMQEDERPYTRASTQIVGNTGPADEMLERFGVPTRASVERRYQGKRVHQPPTEDVDQNSWRNGYGGYMGVSEGNRKTIEESKRREEEYKRFLDHYHQMQEQPIADITFNNDDESLDEVPFSSDEDVFDGDETFSPNGTMTFTEDEQFLDDNNNYFAADTKLLDGHMTFVNDEKLLDDTMTFADDETLLEGDKSPFVDDVPLFDDMSTFPKDSSKPFDYASISPIANLSNSVQEETKKAEHKPVGLRMGRQISRGF